MKTVLKPLCKSVLIPLGLRLAASTADTGIPKKICFGHPSDLVQGTKTLIISNKEMEDIIKKSLDESSLLVKGLSETIENEAKNKGVVY